MYCSSRLTCSSNISDTYEQIVGFKDLRIPSNFAHDVPEADTIGQI